MMNLSMLLRHTGLMKFTVVKTYMIIVQGWYPLLNEFKKEKKETGLSSYKIYFFQI